MKINICHQIINFKLHLSKFSLTFKLPQALHYGSDGNLPVSCKTFDSDTEAAT